MAARKHHHHHTKVVHKLRQRQQRDDEDVAVHSLQAADEVQREGRAQHPEGAAHGQNEVAQVHVACRWLGVVNKTSTNSSEQHNKRDPEEQ